MADEVIALKSSRERAASTFSGYLMLFLFLLDVLLIAFGAFNLNNYAAGWAPVLAVGLGPLLLLLIVPGFFTSHFIL